MRRAKNENWFLNFCLCSSYSKTKSHVDDGDGYDRLVHHRVFVRVMSVSVFVRRLYVPQKCIW